MSWFDDAKKLQAEHVGKLDETMAAIALSGPEQTPERLAKMLRLHAPFMWESPVFGDSSPPLPTHSASGLSFLKALQARAEELGIADILQQAWDLYTEQWNEGEWPEARAFNQVVGDWQLAAEQGHPSGGIYQDHFVMFLPPGRFDPETILEEARKLVLDVDDEPAKPEGGGA